MKRAYRLYAVLQSVQILFVLICGPHSCEWGNQVYFYFGIVSLVLSFLFPFLQKDWPPLKRLIVGVLLHVDSVAVWCAGFLLVEFRIMCRLF